MKISILLMMFSFSAHAVNCNKHPIYCQIKKNSPKINKKHAMKVSNLIYKMKKKYGIPPKIFTAILRQESNYTLKVNGCHKGLREITAVEYSAELERCAKASLTSTDYHFPERCSNNIEKIIETKICSDYGISQIYYKTARKLSIDIDKLTTDLEYSIESGARVLSGFMKRYKKKDKDWWVRYNCGNRGTTKRDTCQIYKKLVERYL